MWGKGEKERTILLNAGAGRELMVLHPAGTRPADSTFRSRHAGPLSATQAWRVIKAAATRAGLETASYFSPHWLQHAHASHALDRGAPVSLVREDLRHTHTRPGDGSSRYAPV